MGFLMTPRRKVRHMVDILELCRLASVAAMAGVQRPAPAWMCGGVASARHGRPAAAEEERCHPTIVNEDLPPPPGHAPRLRLRCRALPWAMPPPAADFGPPPEEVAPPEWLERSRLRQAPGALTLPWR
eukprot:TRINITY_DN34359_c0_g1_i2.p1 TRINITY_DN34359_c0_g1~~TRINITY_DN34359_c0_g1_i2.p1  ORF type:complete len:128 (+),score=20.53 TRINITY_DN34359_c0_g1_i2:276-659(+)